MKHNNYFEFITAPRIVCGRGSIARAGAIAASIGAARALIVADKLFSDNGAAKKIEDSLAKSGVSCAGVFTDIPPDSDMDAIRRGYEQALAGDADIIVGIGGGSALDTAKGIRAMLAEKGSLPEGINVLKGKPIPMIAIPTTAGTGSEATSAAVIHDRSRSLKISYTDPALMPSAAILDPDLTLSLPAALTAATGMDALSHAVEAMQSVNSQPISDGLALQAVTMISSALPSALKNPSDADARESMLIAATIAGMSFSNTLVGITHACAHACGAAFGLHHGVACGLILPYGMEFNLGSTADAAYARIAAAMGIDVSGMDEASAAKAAVRAIREFSKNAGLPASLKSAGVPESGVGALVEKASMDGSMMTNPRQPSNEELKELFMKAWRGDEPCADASTAKKTSQAETATPSGQASTPDQPSDETVKSENKPASEFTVDDMYKVANKFIKKLFGNEAIVEPLHKSGLKMRFVYFNENWNGEEAILTVDCAESPIAVHQGANSPVEPVVTMRMSSETARLFWLQKLNLMGAISKGDITVQGAINEAMRLLPVIKPGFAMFKELK